MVVVPIAMALPKPLALIVATEEIDELQITEAVISCVVPLLKVPVAINCVAVPRPIDLLSGVTIILVRVGRVTVNGAVPLMLPDAALMVVVP